MSKHRPTFETQCLRAQGHSAWHPGPVEVAMVRWPERTMITMVGVAISRLAYDAWQQKGARLRVLRVYENGTPTEMRR